MAMNDHHFIQVRSYLRDRGLQLWQPPYYVEGEGPVDAKMTELAAEVSSALGIDVECCKLVLLNLLERALKNMAARQEFESTGVARFSVRRVANGIGSLTNVDVKCSLESKGSELMALIAQEFGLSSLYQVKCIAGGKIVEPTTPLKEQGIKNNQQLLVIVSELDQTHSDSKEAMYDRIRKIKMDIEAIVDSNQQLFEMEDQDGKPVFMPPNENRAILMAMGFCEKARAAMKRDAYDEALILLLEADTNFSSCNSKFLEAIDNYALVNLDIVWCYLCLKNLNELPDAERRLKLCEDSFRRSYGEDMCRLVAIKGTACAERALLMRLHLMQGVLLFHRNRRQEAREKFKIATRELQDLKISEESLMLLMEMGYEPLESRLGLRSSGGNVERAVNFILERREKLRATRQSSKRERAVGRDLRDNKNGQWVNPRSVNTLVEMGYELDVVVQALRLSKNDIKEALELLTSNQEALRSNLPPVTHADAELLTQLRGLGFDEEMARMALETTENTIERAIEFLVDLTEDGGELFDNLRKLVSSQGSLVSLSPDGPSTSRGVASAADANLARRVLEKLKANKQSLEAYERFNEDVSVQDDDHLDLPLVQEENILTEYKALLDQ